MNRDIFLHALKSPLPNAVLKMFPVGNIMQIWGANPSLYATAFHQMDDLHQFLGGHAGLDILTSWGDVVVAAHDGFVSKIFTDPLQSGGLGVWVQSDALDDGGCIQTVYCHLQDYIVKEGDRITQGQALGHLGNTGFVVSGNTPYWGNAPAGVGAHLHFGLYEYNLKNGALVPRFPNPMRNTTDPLPYLTGDLSGEAGILKQMWALLLKWSSR